MRAICAHKPPRHVTQSRALGLASERRPHLSTASGGAVWVSARAVPSDASGTLAPSLRRPHLQGHAHALRRYGLVPVGPRPRGPGVQRAGRRTRRSPCTDAADLGDVRARVARTRGAEPQRAHARPRSRGAVEFAAAPRPARFARRDTRAPDMRRPAPASLQALARRPGIGPQRRPSPGRTRRAT